MALAAVIGGATVLSAGTQIYTQEKAESRAKKAMAEQKIQQDKLLKQQEDLAKEAQTATTEAQAQQGAQEESASARRRQRLRALGATGRRDTILTGPLGVMGEPEIAGKTLLGL